MTTLVAAALAFAALHLLVSGTRMRDGLVGALGAQGYRAAFSLASAALLGWLIWAYAGSRQPGPGELWHLRGVAGALMLVAFLFIVAGLMTPGPTVVGGEKLLERDNPARGIHRITRHPFLWGVALWAAVHMVFNASVPNLVFFGTFLGVAVAGTFSIDAKRARHFGEKWRRYAAGTSNLPFAAIAQGRNRLVPAEIGAVRLIAALVAFGAFAFLHGRFFGVPVI
jgi:uncharacterized membrane protein